MRTKLITTSVLLAAALWTAPAGAEEAPGAVYEADETTTDSLSPQPPVYEADETTTETVLARPQPSDLVAATPSVPAQTAAQPIELDRLPRTGTSATLALVGTLLVAAGAALAHASRRRLRVAEWSAFMASLRA